MTAENTPLKNIITAGDSNPKTDEMNVGKGNTNQHPFFIIAGSLLALLVLIAVVSKSGSQLLQSSAYKIEEWPKYRKSGSQLLNDEGVGAGALADYQADTSNSALFPNCSIGDCKSAIIAACMFFSCFTRNDSFDVCEKSSILYKLIDCFITYLFCLLFFSSKNHSQYVLGFLQEIILNYL